MDQKTALRLFEYRDGALYRRISPPRTNIPAGSRVGVVNVLGYEVFGHQKKQYRVHRVIYLMHYGHMPLMVDHINGNKLDNHIENLRSADHNTNQYNSKMHCDNTTGAKNVYRDKRTGRFVVKISENGVNRYIGTFGDFDMAAFVASEYRDKMHGIYANHGG